MNHVTSFGSPVTKIDPAKPAPTTSHLGVSITTPYAGSWSRDSFLVATGRAAGAPIATAFTSRADALAAAQALSVGAQPALAVRWDGTAGPRGSTPWVVESLLLANPTPVGFLDRGSREHHTGWRLDHEALDLEGAMTNPNHAAFMAKYLAKAPAANGLAAVVDGAVQLTFE